MSSHRLSDLQIGYVRKALNELKATTVDSDKWPERLFALGAVLYDLDLAGPIRALCSWPVTEGWTQLKSTWQYARHFLVVAVSNAESERLWNKIRAASKTGQPVNERERQRAAELATFAGMQIGDFSPSLRHVDEVTRQRFLTDLEQTVEGLVMGDVAGIPGHEADEAEARRVDIDNRLQLLLDRELKSPELIQEFCADLRELLAGGFNAETLAAADRVVERLWLSIGLLGGKLPERPTFQGLGTPAAAFKDIITGNEQYSRLLQAINQADHAATELIETPLAPVAQPGKMPAVSEVLDAIFAAESANDLIDILQPLQTRYRNVDIHQYRTELRDALWAVMKRIGLNPPAKPDLRGKAGFLFGADAKKLTEECIQSAKEFLSTALATCRAGLARPPKDKAVGGAHGHLPATVAWKEPRRSPLPDLTLEQQSRHCQGFDSDWWIPDLECPNWRTPFYPLHRTRESVADWIAGAETLIRANYGGFQDPDGAAKLKSDLESDLTLIRRFAPDLLSGSPAEIATGGSEGGPPPAGRSRGIPLEEAEILVRDWLTKNAKEEPAAVTRDAVAAGTGVSKGQVSKCAAWVAFRDRRNAERKPSERVIPLKTTMLVNIPTDDETPEVAALRKEQEAEEAEDLRRHESRHEPS